MSDAGIEETILTLVRAAEAGRTVSPTEVARAIDATPQWHRRMGAVRRAAVALAAAGHIAIYRKGKPVDPNDFKGVYRLGLPPPD